MSVGAVGGVDDARNVGAELLGTDNRKSIVRFVPPSTRRLLGRITGVLFVVPGLFVVTLAGSAQNVANPGAATGLGFVAVAVGCILLGIGIVGSSLVENDTLWTVSVPATLLVAVVLISLGLSFAGPHWTIVTGLYLEAPIFGFYLLRRMVAVGFIVVVAAAFAIVLAVGTGYASPAFQWVALVSTVAGVGAGVGEFIARADQLAASEREAHAEVERLNRTLEQRVTAQVDELGRLGRLRRFLSPQVAEAMLTSRGEEVLQPHRRQIAVFFCDLRGFTTFAGGAEPEEVVEALDEYYKVVGSVLRRYDATVGAFAGDGIMAYLNDPVPCEDPAGSAVRMAMDLGEPMAAYLERWKRRGHELGYGIGIAFGYATLGIIGFEGRNDYTALGSVVNLASRLCAEATSTQVLVDSRTYDALKDDVCSARREIVLKGFPSPIAAFEIFR